VQSGRWQVCTSPNFKGDCQVLEPGRYASLEQNLNHRIESARQLEVDARDERNRNYADDGNWRDRRYDGYDNRYDNRDNRDWHDRRDWNDRRDDRYDSQDYRYGAPQDYRDSYRYGR